MQTKKKTISFLLVLLLAAAALVLYFLLRDNKTVVTAKPPVQYVSAIINDVTLPEHRLVSKFSRADASGSIFLTGSPERTSSLSKALCEWDSFDNVDGRAVPDGLMDFAGESISTLASLPDEYRLIASGQTDSLRDYTVRVALAALDTLCYLSPYDPTGMGRKLTPKMLVTASPYMTQYGKYDIDSLFHALGCHIPVLSPAELSLSEVFEGKPKGARLNIGVLLPQNRADSVAWINYTAEKSLQAGLDTARCIVYTAPENADALTSFLDYYVESGNRGAIDALVIDDPSVDTEAIRQSLERITSVMNAESLTYGNMFGKDFSMVNSTDCICKAIYRYMRQYNLFTHRVAQPRQYDYMLIGTEGSLKEFKLMHFNERFITKND